MSWNSSNLGNVFATQLATAQAKVASLTAELARLTGLESSAISNKNDAQSLVDTAQQLIDDLASSGIFVLSLPSAQGLWSQRLLDAVNSPPRTSSNCAILANIIQGASGSAITSSYNSMKSALVSALKVPSPENNFTPKATLIQESAPVYPTESSWQVISLGAMMPGTLVGAQNQLNEARKIFSKTDQALESVQSKKTAISTALAEANNTVSSLSGTGVYTVQIVPTLGDWFNLLTTESGGPSSDSNLYSAGMITVIRNANYSVALDQWTKLLGSL